MQVGSGFTARGQRWTAVVHAGPWGYCLSLGVSAVLELEGRCLSPAAAAVAGLKANVPPRPGGNARWLIGTTSRAVSYIRLSLADRSTVWAPAVAVDGQRFFAAAAVVRGMAVSRWGAFDPAGRRLYGGVGEPGR